jgi:hypothetical protein
MDLERLVVARGFFTVRGYGEPVLFPRHKKESVKKNGQRLKPPAVGVMLGRGREAVTGNMKEKHETMVPLASGFPGNGLVLDPALRAPSRSISDSSKNRRVTVSQRHA